MADKAEERGGSPDATLAREARRQLVIAQDLGQTMSIAQLREELGAGHDDLMAVLDDLRKRGMAAEVSPGEWSAGDGGAGSEPEDAPEPVRVHVPESGDGDGEAPPAARRSTYEELEANGAFFEGARPYSAGEPTVRLTMAIANALDADALGKLIKAGIEEAASHDEAFVLEVVP